MVALTFDDGPVPGITDRVLEILASRQHRATFFLIGERAERHPELMSLLRASGCEIGNHTYSHSEAWNESYRRVRDEIEVTDEIVAGSRQAALPFRPPRGRLSFRVMLYLWRRRRRIAPVLWSACVPLEDRLPPEEVASVLASAALEAGDIILLHDDHAGIIDALPLILDCLEHRGLRSVPLSEIFQS